MQRFLAHDAKFSCSPGHESIGTVQPGDAVAITIHPVEVTTPGVVVYGAYTGDDPLAWWDDESACAVYPAAGGSLRFDERTTLPTRAR